MPRKQKQQPKKRSWDDMTEEERAFEQKFLAMSPLDKLMFLCDLAGVHGIDLPPPPKSRK